MIALNKDTYGYKAKLAESAGCQRSFLSQVLSGLTHLGQEHAIGLAVYWGLSTHEKDYFLNLVSYARAATKTLKEYFALKLEDARKDQENLVRRIVDKVVLPDIKAATFYSTWQYLAITILLTIQEYRTVKAIAQRLNLSDTVVERSLSELLQLDMVAKSGQEWIPASSTIHLPGDSKFNSLNHSHWRNKAIQDSLLSENKSVHYTSVCSVSLEDAEKLRQLMFRVIGESRKIVAPSKEEELFCLTCDWFKV
jgi:uncharacterized protein (TIGR02147 family)